jgi:hypothetical protein
MIEDNKRKTRRVSKKVKKMHEEAVAKGILGATQEAKKGGSMEVYKIDIKKGGEVVSSEVKDLIGIKFISLDDILKKLDSGNVMRIEKSDLFGRTSHIYKFEEL